jgi:hypothetical protein
MKYLKLFESFGSFQLDEITRKEFVDIHKNREDENINYRGLQLMGENIPKDYTLSHGGEWFTIHHCDESKKINIKISVDKVSQGGDEPFYTLQYYYDIYKGNRYNDRHHFFRFEESDFNQMCKNPQILIDYLNKYFDESIIEMDGAIDETFGFSRGINPDILTREQFESLSRQSIHMRFSSKTTVGLTIKSRGTGININYDSKVKQHIMFYFNYSYFDAKMIFNTKFSVMKIEDDEPYVYFQSGYGYRNVGTDFTNYQNYPQDQTIYGRMEVEEFDQIIKNPRLWKDWMVDKTFELDQQTHKILKESLFDIPDPEPMDVNEWDDEVTNAQEIAFTQKEKELFISLSDTISVKNKIRSMPDIGKFYLYFQLINGDLNPKLRETTPISNISIYKNDDEFYFVALWTGDGLFAERELWAGGEKLYRCDGYECLEKFLREIFQGYRELTGQNKTNESYFDEVPEPELMDDNEWWDEVFNSKEIDFNQKEKELFIALSDTISAKHKIDLDALEIGDSQLSFSMVNGHDGIYPGLSYSTVIRSITSYKNDDEFYYVNVWGDDSVWETKSYRCDGYECWEKFLKEIFQGYRELISKGNKTNESMFDYVPEPRSLLDENGDYIPGKSRDRMNNREPFNQKEKSFINQLLETLNEEYVSTNFSDSSEFVLNMGEMGETTHGMRVVKLTDDYYEVQYNNFVDSDDEYIYCECDGFKCLSKLLIELFEKINKDYDYEG